MSDFEDGDAPLIRNARRRRGWETRLVHDVDEFLKDPFHWPTHNCGHLMATAVLACHGDDHPLLDELRAGTQEECQAYLRSKGGMDKILGAYLEKIPVLMAQDGDLATFGVDPEVRAGCIVLSGQLVGLGEDKVWRLPITKAAAIYRV